MPSHAASYLLPRATQRQTAHWIPSWTSVGTPRQTTYPLLVPLTVLITPRTLGVWVRTVCPAVHGTRLHAAATMRPTLEGHCQQEAAREPLGLSRLRSWWTAVATMLRAEASALAPTKAHWRWHWSPPWRMTEGVRATPMAMTVQLDLRCRVRHLMWQRLQTARPPSPAHSKWEREETGREEISRGASMHVTLLRAVHALAITQGQVPTMTEAWDVGASGIEPTFDAAPAAVTASDP